MEIVDAHLHVSSLVPPGYDEQPYRPIDGGVAWPIEAAIAAMEVTGVQAALIDSLHLTTLDDGTVVPDNTYAIECTHRYPGVFAAIGLYPPASPDIGDVLAAAAEEPGLVGARLYLRTTAEVAGLAEGRYDRFLKAAQASELPVLSLMYRHLDAAEHILSTYPGLTLVIEHCGLAQPPWRVDDPPFADLKSLLELARHPGAIVKWSGAPTYSRESFPYEDLWGELGRMVDAFGPERLMWGSDMTRFFGAYTYSELLDYIRLTPHLTDREKCLVLGGTARRVFRWAGPAGPPIPRGWRFDPDDPPSWIAD